MSYVRIVKYVPNTTRTLYTVVTELLDIHNPVVMLLDGKWLDVCQI